MNDFYENHYREYYQSTVNLDPSPFLTPFAAFLTPGSCVLDVGCGSGRDLRWFARQGYCPVGFEYSPSLAELARQYSHRPVLVGDFCSYDFSALEFDALSLVGSLVHVSAEMFPAVLQNICQSLRQGGHVLITLKEGSGTYCTEDGRIFTLWQQNELEKTLYGLDFEIVDFFRRRSQLRSNDYWLGFVVRQMNNSTINSYASAGFCS